MRSNWNRAGLFILLFIIMLSGISTAQDRVSVTYEPDQATIANPERGFFYQDAPIGLNGELSPQDTDYLLDLRDQKITLIRWYFILDQFVEAPLDTETLAYIDEQFSHAREAGLKVIPRFGYNFPSDLSSLPDEASLPQIVAHIEQLTPILQKNADVIAFMEAGLIGAWGEWHSSSHGLIEVDGRVNDATRQLVDALLIALPTERMLVVRQPLHKQGLFGLEPLTESEAFTGIGAARVGAHNDCFLASYTDYGTYSEEPAAREAAREFLHLDNRYVPQGGETCNADEEAAPFITCENALADLAYLRYSALNVTYHEEVLQNWRDEGCFDEIENRLGYRLRLLSASTFPNVAQGSSLNLSLALINEGFAAPYNPRGLEVMLRNTADGALYHFDISDQHDPRFWLPDNGEMNLDINVPVTSDIPPGNYELLLFLPDPMLYDRPEYAIRFANEGLWEDETGMNSLKLVVRIE